MGLQGEFNDAVFGLAPAPNLDEVRAAADRLLQPYGGVGAVARDRQSSNYFLTQKLAQIATMATMIPALFLAVAAFLVNLVLSRIVGSQREQIATLKALGYGMAALAPALSAARAGCLHAGRDPGRGPGTAPDAAVVRFFVHYFNLPVAVVRFDPWGGR